jgi:hypothetical protein
LPDYLSRRQNSIPEAPVEASNRMLEAIADGFGVDWLEASPDNPVQQLWQRKDWLATTELLTLGDALQRLHVVDAAWTKRQVDEMKSQDPGTRSGATFELLGLNLFSDPGTVEPAPMHNPGYDGRIVFSDGSSLILSIKNHGISSGEIEFKRRAASVNDAFVAALRRRSMNGVQQRIITPVHPSTADWNRLVGRMDEILGGNVSPDATAPWSGLIQPIDAKFLPLSSAHLSRAILLAAPYRQNEQKNFNSNIEKGIANLVKHHSKANINVCRGLLLRLSETADMNSCVEWVRQYFVQYPNTPLELVLLYQVAITADLTNNTNFIAHCFLPVLGHGYTAWQESKPARRFAIRVLIGKLINKPSRLVLTGGQNMPQLTLDGHYVFQEGEIFPYYRMTKGTLNISLASPAAGVSVIPVIEQGGAIGSIAAIVPPAMRLTLLE